MKPPQYMKCQQIDCNKVGTFVDKDKKNIARIMPQKIINISVLIHVLNLIVRSNLVSGLKVKKQNIVLNIS